jgi:two-component system chemotaxis sensor kinase CheA
MRGQEYTPVTDVTEGVDEIVQDFLLESYESLELYDRDLVALEQDPTSPELLSEIFRIVHTVKGTCGFLPFRRLESVAHAGESLLTGLRHGHLPMTQDVTDALLDLGDAIRTLLRSIEVTGEEGAESFCDLVSRLNELQAVDAPSRPGGAVDQEPAPAAVEDAAPAVDPAPTAAPSEPRSAVSDGKIRVDVGLLDSMMNLVGELVLTRNQLAQRATGEDGDLRHLSQRLRLITAGLQEGVMQARMQPIDTVWNKLPRVVRDLSVQLGRSVRLEMEGADTEMDRTILEAIKDPMTHIVRNAIDHGIEDPATRAAAGKPEGGVLSLRAFHQGGLVNIEITDDGAGMDPEDLRRTAVLRGAVTAEQAARLGDKESFALIFRPGFSTASEVTNVSGRGVGMDVVKTNIERIGGLVDVESVRGHGTTFRIKIPLTLAIIPALVVRTHGQRYAIPQPSVQELVQLGTSAAGGRLERAHDAPVYRLRGALLPLVDLREQLDLPLTDSSAGTIVVLQAEGRSVGLVVDTVVGTEEVVVKPLGTQLRDIDLYAGATTMGDGGVALILDVAALAKRAGVLSSAGEERDLPADSEPAHRLAPQPGEEEDGPRTVRLLLLALADGSRAALPLAVVRRLEKIPTSAVDHVGDSYLVNYRDGLLPLIHADAALSGVADVDDEDTRLTVIVCRIEGVTVGLVVSGIVDIVDGEPLSTARPGPDAQPGAQDRAPVLVGDHLTALLDLDDLLLAVDPQLLVHTTSAEALR